MSDFKNCKECYFTWKDRESFLSDTDIKLTGYHAKFDMINNGLFLFNHICGATLSFPVKMFTGLYEGPKYKNILTNSEKCEGHCLDENDLSPCTAECKFAFCREILQIILKWQKAGKPFDEPATTK